mmetsp:Transcript_33126/g.103725  ORF Transcript_33126/g.103725 Transcript_33126/m.103725 type:complete len:173 (-) Transcript_33126:2-520(-)
MDSLSHLMNAGRLPGFEGGHGLKAKRYAVYHLNLWRNASQQEIGDYHLAVLDRSSVVPGHAERTALTFDGFKLEQYRLRHAPGQRWFYFPRMRADEILMFTQGKCIMEVDPAAGNRGGPVFRFFLPASDEHPHSVLHTAIRDPSAPLGAQRHSCENRFYVFVPVDEPKTSKL